MRFYSLIGLLFLAGLGASCNKDKIQTRPSIKLKSAGPGFVASGGTYSVILSFTDKEGDISDSLFVQKIRTNKRFTPTIRNNFRLDMPAVPDATNGTVNITLSYEYYLVSADPPPNLGGSPPVFENDSLIIKFVLRDQAGNTSDTVSTPLVVVSRN